MAKATPPALARWLLQRRYSADKFEPIAGDLEEGFFDRVASHGRARARWWYWREACGFLLARRRNAELARSRWAPVLSTGRDLRFGLRMLRRHPAFACSAIVVMALGIGTTTAVFSVLRGVLIAPLPYHDPGRLVAFRASLPDVPRTPTLTSIEFAAIRARTDLFESVAAIVGADGSLTAADIMAPVNAAAASAGFLETFGVTPLIGRALRTGDSGSRGSVNISYEIWQRHFHGNPDILGTPIEVNGDPLMVAGVLPQGFKTYLGSGVALPQQIDVLYFRGRGYDEDPFRGNVVVGRLRQGVTIEHARAAIDAIAGHLVNDHPGSYRTGPVRLSVAPLDAEVVSDARPALIAAAGAVLLVLIVTCANLANLLLSRASARAREMAVRASIGAGRGDIARQLLAEGLVVGAAGAALGWMAAHWGVAALLALAPASLPRREMIAVDAGVALFAMGLAFVCALVVSLVPAWHATRPALSAAAKGARSGGTTRGLLVASQLALSVVLLVGAGLMARAFVNIRSVPLGFDPAQSASMFLSVSDQRWNAGTFEEARALRRGFYERLIDHAQALPGVRVAGAGFPVPLSGVSMSQRVALGPDQRERETDAFIAFAGYLEALGVPLTAGRYFSRADNSQPVVIVDERLAGDLWPGESAIGKRLLIVRSVSTPMWAEVVGVVAHVQARGLREPGLPQVWMTYAVRAYAQLNVVTRAADPLGAIQQTADAARQLGAGRPARDLTLLDDMVADASADTRFALFVLGVLSVAAVILAGVGVYGVVSFAMTRRTREIAVRLALGESPHRLVARVLGDGIPWTMLGLGAGLAGAALMARSLESLLFRIGPHDALTFVVVAVGLSALSLVASVVPAFRAGRVDPMLTLRSE